MIYCIRIVCWHFWRLINVFFWGESHLCQYAPYILANICEKKWKEKRRRIRSKRREKKKNVSRFETATWQLLACVLTQLAIDLVTAERKTREFWVESQPDPSFPHFFTPPIPSRLVLLTEGLEQATIWISVWDFSDLVPPSPPLEKKGIKKGLKVDQFHDRHFVRQGSYGPWKPGKSCNFILTFSKTRKSWKKRLRVLEK